MLGDPERRGEFDSLAEDVALRDDFVLVVAKADVVEAPDEVGVADWQLVAVEVTVAVVVFMADSECEEVTVDVIVPDDDAVAVGLTVDEADTVEVTVSVQVAELDIVAVAVTVAEMVAVDEIEGVCVADPVMREDVVDDGVLERIAVDVVEIE